ncbi:hypothetical protein CRYUN_Cryun20dG0020500 [Craigia yunnanensis]
MIALEGWKDKQNPMPKWGLRIMWVTRVCARFIRVIYVNRFSPASRKNAINEIKRTASFDTFPRVLLFPEGTTNNGKVLISFQLGAFIPGHPIQLIIVLYPHLHL